MKNKTWIMNYEKKTWMQLSLGDNSESNEKAQELKKKEPSTISPKNLIWQIMP